MMDAKFSIVVLLFWTCTFLTAPVHVLGGKKIKPRLDKLEKTITTSTMEISALQQTARSIEERLTALDDSLNKAVDALTSKLDNKVIDTTNYIDTKVSAIQDNISSTTNILNKKIDEYKTDSVTIDDVLRLQQGKKISFSARLKPSVSDIAPDSTLVLADVVTNEGNGYSSTTGKFTAPIDGIYVFFVHVLGANRVLEMAMNKNDQRIMYVYVDGRNYGDGSNMVVLKLVKGDTVNVVKHGPWGARPFYVHHRWTTFSGFLLYEN